MTDDFIKKWVRKAAEKEKIILDSIRMDGRVKYDGREISFGVRCLSSSILVILMNTIASATIDELHESIVSENRTMNFIFPCFDFTNDRMKLDASEYFNWDISSMYSPSCFLFCTSTIP